MIRRGCGVLLASALLAACGGNAEPSTREPAAKGPSFVSDIAPILKTRCATCHLTGQEAGAMALHPGAAYSNIVGVPAVSAPKMLRVAPEQPERSYLMLKLEGKHLDAGGSGSQMPLGGPPLDGPTLELVREWIRAGALNN